MYKVLTLFVSIIFAQLSLGAATLHIGTKESVSTLSPLDQGPGLHPFLRGFVAPPVVSLGPDWLWRCIVCTSLPTTKEVTIFAPPKRGLEAHFSIDPKWHWNDGTPVTGLDVAFTLNFLKRIGKHPILSTPGTVTVTVNPKDTRSFVLKVSHLRSDFLSILSISLLPNHKRHNIETLYQNPTTTKGLFYGPYEPGSINGDIIQLKPREPKLQALEVHTYKDQHALFKAFELGEVDMIAEGEISIRDAINLREKRGAQFRPIKIIATPSHVIEHLVFNSRNPTLIDPVLRQALLYAINREEIVAKVYKNQGRRADQLYHHQDPYFAEGIKVYDFNPAIAARLLDSAGWSLNSQGQRQKGDVVLTLTIDGTDSEERQLEAAIIKKNWKALGIEVNYTPHSKDYFLNHIVNKTRYRDMVLLSWDQTPSIGFWLPLHSREIPAIENQYSGSNVGVYSRREVDQLLLAMFRTTKDTKMMQLSRNLMNHYVSDLPSLPLAFVPKVSLIPEGLQNFQMPGHSFPSSLYAGSWRFIDHDIRQSNQLF